MHSRTWARTRSARRWWSGRTFRSTDLRLAERRLAVGLPPLEEQIEKARSRATAEGERSPAAHQAYAKVRDEWAASVGWRGG